MTAVEFSAARPVAIGGTAPGPRAENVVSSETGLAAEPVCPQCGWAHQAREREVPCVVCHRRWTTRFHAVCEVCEPGGHIT